METHRIGSLEVSVVGLGCNNFGGRLDEVQTREVVDAALASGITLLDTADNYGNERSEEFLGGILEGRRDEVVLATKFGGWQEALGREAGAAPAQVRSALEASLRRLRTDHIDLYQLHSPDASTPIADTLGALDALVREGKVREIGCSNFTPAMLHEADEAARACGSVPFTCVQNELSLLALDDASEALPVAAELGMAYLPFFPLANGLLTGKFRRDATPATGTRVAGWTPERRRDQLTDATWDRIEALTSFAADRGHSMLELAFAFLLAQGPVASVIAGATSPEQVSANVAAGTWRLTAEELAAIPR